MTRGYLDHAATTPLHPEALDAMLPFLTTRFGNPSGGHPVARDARRAVDEARDAIAAALGCRPGEVIVTSGATEADNQAVTGTLRRRGGVAVCTAAEHHAVLDPVLAAGGRVVPVDADGAVDLDALAEALDDSVTLVSTVLVNNEVGTVQPLAEVAEVVRERAPGALLHTDAVQAVPWLDVAAVAAPADLVSVSAHKFGGPKGIGALVARNGADPAPLLLGGGQERGRRSGTSNVAGIVGMAAALALTTERREATVARLRALRDRLADGLVATVPGLTETGRRDRKVAGSCHVCVDGVESECLLVLLEDRGVCASAASSCSSGAMDPSHVLAAMGVPRERAAGSLRLTLGWTSTDEDVDLALAAVPDAVDQLRRPVVLR
ncbi:MAG TPA: cysteine desulfurase family protein [Acidimicrobiales bacterium]